MRISDWSSDVCSSDLILGAISECSGGPDGEQRIPQSHKAGDRHCHFASPAAQGAIADAQIDQLQLGSVRIATISGREWLEIGARVVGCSPKNVLYKTGRTSGRERV